MEVFCKMSHFSKFGKLCAVAVALCVSALSMKDAQAARGRPHLNAEGTTFVADNGNLLRGPLIATESGNLPSHTAIQAVKNYGCNAIHVYAEAPTGGYTAGTRAAVLDQVVNWTRDDGLYLIITIGSGGVNTSFINDFWNFYAGRYANETHVIYEIQNEAVSYPGVSASVISAELGAYNIIRSKAPNTPVLFFSYMAFQNGANVVQDINALGTGVDWSNAAIAFHGYGQGGRNTCRSTMQYVLNAGYPIFMTEFYTWPWGMGVANIADGTSMYQHSGETGDCERLKVSWLTFITTSRLTTVDDSFKNIINNAGIVWTPDYGTWPSGSRGSYGNSGEPWTLNSITATLHVEAENYDSGGEGVGYHDDTAGNSGNGYRTSENVDVQTTSDTGAGYNVGWFNTNEWLEYTCYINEAGIYNLKLRVASPQSSNSVQVLFGGVDKTGTWTFAGNGGNQNWVTISKEVTLTPGQQVIRIKALTTGFNLNWFELSGITTGKIANGTYKIVNQNSGKVLDVVDASTADGAQVQQWAYGGGSNQKWTITHLGANQYKILCVQTGKSIDIASQDRVNGTKLGIWTYYGNPQQRFIITPASTGYYRISPVHDGLAFDVPSSSTANGTLIQQWQYSGAANQQWAFGTP